MRNIFFGAFSILIAVLGVGCGGNGSTSGGSAVSLVLDSSVLNVGQSSVATLEFSFKADEVFNHGENVAITVRLPAGVGFHPESGEIDLPGGSDESVGNQVTNCGGTGESYVVFNLGRQDLLLAVNPDGDADARLTFTVDGISAVNSSMDARAADDSAFTCGQTFVADVSAAVQVL